MLRRFCNQCDKEIPKDATVELESGKLFYIQNAKVERDVIGWKRIEPIKVVNNESS